MLRKLDQRVGGVTRGPGAVVRNAAARAAGSEALRVMALAPVSGGRADGRDELRRLALVSPGVALRGTEDRLFARS